MGVSLALATQSNSTQRTHRRQRIGIQRRKAEVSSSRSPKQKKAAETTPSLLGAQSVQYRYSSGGDALVNEYVH